jgi:hypothetical protein
LICVEPPVFAILMAATGAQAGDAERDGVGCRDLLLDADDERDARETLADALRERERDADAAAAAREPDGDGERVGDGDAADDSDGDGEADTATHTAFAHTNVCVKARVSGTLERTCADAPRSSSVCVAARS